MSVIHYDHETGEVVLETVNEETGEVTFSAGCAPLAADPAAAVASSAPPAITPIRHSVSRHSAHSRRYRNLKHRIMTGCNTTSHLLFLIPPTILCFPTVVTVLVVILEVAIHIICHKKNRVLRDPNLYYRSPLHILTREFCAFCREDEAAERVARMQDQRRQHYDYSSSLRNSRLLTMIIDNSIVS